MIHKIWASDRRFKPVEFKRGLNVILAERTQTSGDKDTRNGAGKTTLLNIVHFCLGSDLKKMNLPKDEMQDWAFFIQMDICGQMVTAKRSIGKPAVIEVDGVVENVPVAPEKDSDGVVFYKNDDWKKLLGICLFNIKENASAKYSSSFRSLIHYFTRRGADAYTDPFKHFRSQPTWNWQVNNSFLLGLNWLHASEAQEIRDREEATKALNSAVKAGIVLSQGELEAERVQIERELTVESDSVRSFNVHPQYKALQTQANKLTNEIHSISNEALIMTRKLDRYQESVASEKAPDSTAVEKLYSEAGVHFSENVKKSLVAAKSFHESIVRNRKLFLEAEIVQLKNDLATLENSLSLKSDERAELMCLLNSHGALEEFSLLQEKVLEKRKELVDIKAKISDIRDMAIRKKDIKTSKMELETKMQRDYEQSRSEWGKAMRLFNENSLALYEEPGNLIINATEKGYQLDVEIQKSGSEGVGKMKIFCYDLMLTELMTQRGGVNFLFHDSSIYDGVDSRQRALALQYAHKKASEGDFQYICFLNSDLIPHEDFKDEFSVENFVRLKLRDQTAADSVLGFHFELFKRKKE